MIETTVETVGVESARTVSPEATVTDAAQHLREPGVPALAVLEDGAVVGIVTPSDIVALVAETDQQPTVRAVMSSPVTTIAPGATVSEAAETMRAAGVRHLPVVGDGVYRGVLSTASLAPYLTRSALDVEWQGDPMRIGTPDGQQFSASD